MEKDDWDGMNRRLKKVEGNVCDSGRREDKDSVLKVQWWQVILVFITMSGFIFSWLITHENRITKTETSTEYIIKNIDEMKILLKETNQGVMDMKR